MSVPSIVVVTAVALAGFHGAIQMGPGPTPFALDAGSGSSGDEDGTQVELRFDETAKHRDLELRWIELEDSRCPIGVACVWAGQIVATVEVARGEEESVELDLVHRIKGPPATSRAFGYELRLLGVDPHPKQGTTPERSDYIARIEIAEP